LDWTWGSISVSGLNWTFEAGTQSLGTSFGPMAVTGSGTFSPKVSMDGTYARGGGSSSAWGPLEYSHENALAVNQASLVGKWENKDADFGMLIEVDAAGAFAGSTSGKDTGVCKVTGTVVHVQPESSKNIFAVELQATNAATGTEKACGLDTTGVHKGPAAILLSPAGTYVGNGYFRSLVFHVLSSQSVYTQYLDKQR
jgi:hypothetical protein